MGSAIRLAILFPAIVLGAACGASETEATATPGPSPTLTTSPTLTRTQTPTPTPTPTATAPPAVVFGNPRSLIVSDPIPQSGAPCGFVDTFDFPLDPPDGALASGGGDYGRFRTRYDGYHTGEDWRVGGNSFRQPVHSIGHGQVTYAQPNGWGADKGVVIIQHVFHDRGRILSFYGHLDPPSISLRAGQCVERGDVVGNIGDPRSPPHLHFEIRVHLPDTPGPGYWSVDPTRAGWRPPSAMIWNERIAALPGVLWTYLNEVRRLQLLDMVNGELLLASSEGELLSVGMDNGRLRWTRRLASSAFEAVLDSEGELLYVVNATGRLEAYVAADLSSNGTGSPGEPVWTVELRAVPKGFIAIPEGGLVLASRRGITAISSAGQELWHENAPTEIIDWAETRGRLIVLSRDGIWMIGEGEAAHLTDAVSGHKVVASDHPYIYAEDGIYSVDLEARSTEPFFDLPKGFPRSGDITELPGGGVLVAHLDTDDKRLIAIESDGSLRWERSIADLRTRAVDLLTLDDRTYLMAQISSGSSTGFELFSVDAINGALLHILSGGTRASSSRLPAIVVEGETLMISIPGIGISRVDPLMALDAPREP